MLIVFLLAGHPFTYTIKISLLKQGHRSQSLSPWLVAMAYLPLIHKCLVSCSTMSAVFCWPEKYEVDQIRDVLAVFVKG